MKYVPQTKTFLITQIIIHLQSVVTFQFLLGEKIDEGWRDILEYA